MAIKTSKRQEKEKRDAKIKKMYDHYMGITGSQVYGAYEQLARLFSISPTTVGRIVGNIKRSKNI